MIKMKSVFIIAIFLCVASAASHGQEEPSASENSFDKAADSVQQKLDKSLTELKELRERVVEEKVPLSRKLNALESKLSDVRIEFQQASRLLDTRTLDLSNLQNEIKTRQQEATYLSNLLSEYIRNFETRLHIAEMDRYEQVLEEAKLAPENSSLSQQEVYKRQAALLTESLARLFDALNGSRFNGTAVDEEGMVEPGTFVLVGPSAIFRSKDGEDVGSVQQRLGSLEPAVASFGNPDDANVASELIASGEGRFPFDPTLGNAQKIEQTQETFVEHIQKGGVVMYPIFILAGLALLVALFKALTTMVLRKPSQGQIKAMLNAIANRDPKELKRQAIGIRKVDPRVIVGTSARWCAGGVAVGLLLWAVDAYFPAVTKWLWPMFPASLEIGSNDWMLPLIGAVGLGVLGIAWGIIKYFLQLIFGYSPVGDMLATGVDHIKEPRELIEEVMYEKVLSTRLKLESFLPFVAICAASAPLLGLLGTVTGIINTFKLITVFGTGDVQTLSGGISEALITTEFGLIVAIPSLLLHAFLSRRARGVIDQMEKAAVALINQVGKTPFEPTKVPKDIEEEEAARPVPDAEDEEAEEDENQLYDEPRSEDGGNGGPKKRKESPVESKSSYERAE